MASSTTSKRDRSNDEIRKPNPSITREVAAVKADSNSSQDLRIAHENFSKIEACIRDKRVEKITEENISSFPIFHMKERYRSYRRTIFHYNF